MLWYYFYGLVKTKIFVTCFLAIKSSFLFFFFCFLVRPLYAIKRYLSTSAGSRWCCPSRCSMQFLKGISQIGQDRQPLFWPYVIIAATLSGVHIFEWPEFLTLYVLQVVQNSHLARCLSIFDHLPRLFMSIRSVLPHWGHLSVVASAFYEHGLRFIYTFSHTETYTLKPKSF